ncbi:hypothetical protein [Dasania marina]|uniref:hypothetical protein n=1 Tax=Dasania marina TaxID=471499 RepID=UPI00035F49D4|nr:hypothetical protein [Dasania marina]
MDIIRYQEEYYYAAIALMAELQDHEHQLCPELIPTGSAVAEAHLNYLIGHSSKTTALFI